MKINANNSNLILNIKNLTVGAGATLGNDISDIITFNGSTTFNERITMDKKVFVNSVRVVSTTSILNDSTPPVITKDYRYYYINTSTSNSYCNLWEAGVSGTSGATITILNRGTAAVRIYGYGGYTTTSSYTSPANEQRIMDHKGNIQPFITLGQTDWVELIESPTLNLFGWIVTEAVGI